MWDLRRFANRSAAFSERLGRQLWILFGEYWWLFVAYTIGAIIAVLGKYFCP